MRSLFHSRDPEPASTVEPVPTVFPKIAGADIAAVFAGKRVAGDFYDSVRVSPERILFGLLDVAGRREENRGILTAAQEIFRNFGAELFSRSDINESEAMTDLSLRMNRGIIETVSGVHSCPAFIACYHERFGTLCYSNAGHTPGLLRDSGGIIELSSTGLPLGLFSHATMLQRSACRRVPLSCWFLADWSTARVLTNAPARSSAWQASNSFSRLPRSALLRISAPLSSMPSVNTAVKRPCATTGPPWLS